jgi:hypothetical protein
MVTMFADLRGITRSAALDSVQFVAKSEAAQ